MMTAKIAEFNEVFDGFRSSYDECSSLIQQAIESEATDGNKALETYKQAIALIDEAMLLTISTPTCSDEDELKTVQSKFKMQRSEIQSRIGRIYRKIENEPGGKISSESQASATKTRLIKDDGQVKFDNIPESDEDVARIRRSSGDKVSDNISTGAECVSHCLTKTADKTGEFFDHSTPYILSKIRKAPENVPPVSEKVQTTVIVAKNLTGYAAKGTSYVAKKVRTVMKRTGRFLAPHVQKQGSKLLGCAGGIDNEKAEEAMSETLKIAGGTASGISTVFNGLETSAGILGKNLAKNTEQIVQYKYGEPVGEVTSEAFDTVGNLFNVNKNFKFMTPKGLLKSTAKNAGKGILQIE